MKFDRLSLFYQFTRLFWVLNLAIFVVICWLVAQVGFGLMSIVTLILLIASMAYATDAIQSIRNKYHETRILQLMTKALEDKDYKRYRKIAEANIHLKSAQRAVAFAQLLVELTAVPHVPPEKGETEINTYGAPK